MYLKSKTIEKLNGKGKIVEFSDFQFKECLCE